MNLLAEVGNALGEVITWCGTVVTAVTTDAGALNPLLPLWAVGIGISALMLGVRVMRGFAWGN